MVGKTHAIGGVAAALATANFVPSFRPDTIGLYGTAIFAATASFGALLSDVDTNGTISHYPVFNLCHLFFKLFGVKHRGMTHSLPFDLVFFVLGVIMGKTLGTAGFLIGAGITVGVFSHIILDMLNPAGVQLFFPLPMKISIGSIKTGGLGDFIVRIVLSIFSVAMLPGLFYK